jgi:hypothetical protein
VSAPSKPSDAAKTAAKKVLIEALDQSLFGKTNEDFFKEREKKGGRPSDGFWSFLPGKTAGEKYDEKYAERSETLRKFNAANDSMEAFFRKHPGATQVEASQEAQKLIGIQATRKTGSAVFGSGSGKPTGSTKDDTLKRVKGILGGGKTPDPNDVFAPLPSGQGGTSSPAALIPELKDSKTGR